MRSCANREHGASEAENQEAIFPFPFKTTTGLRLAGSELNNKASVTSQKQTQGPKP